MITQGCPSQPTSALINRFSNLFLVPNLKRATTSKPELDANCRLKSSSRNLRIHALETEANQLDGAILEGSRTESQYGDLVWPSPSDEIPFWKREFPSWDISTSDPVDIQKDSDPMHIVHVTAEMAPIAKVGGLGDVVTGLARACLVRGHTVDVFLPFYECINKQHIKELTLTSTYESYYDGSWIPTNVYRGIVFGIPVVFIEPSNAFFKGQSVYGGSYNELEAYLFFTRACLEWLQVSATQPDIIHVHEWQTAALPLLYWDMYQYLSLKVEDTFHNKLLL